MDDLNDHPHYALLRSESYVSPSERMWEKWVRAVEKLLGHDLDRTQWMDGCSMDSGYDAFMAHTTPADYVAEVSEWREEQYS